MLWIARIGNATVCRKHKNVKRRNGLFMIDLNVLIQSAYVTIKCKIEILTTCTFLKIRNENMGFICFVEFIIFQSKDLFR